MQHRTINPDQLDVAVSLLLSGELLIFPTDTVYGLGGNAYSDVVVEKVFFYKRRDKNKPLSVCYDSFVSACDDIEINDYAEKIAESFFPGAVTLVLKRARNSQISNLCCAVDGSVGVRVPNCAIALNLLKRIPFPLTATSANRSGDSSKSTAKEAFDSLKCENLNVIVDECENLIGKASTVIDLTKKFPTILRVGAISVEELADKTGFKFMSIE